MLPAYSWRRQPGTLAIYLFETTPGGRLRTGHVQRGVEPG